MRNKFIWTVLFIIFCLYLPNYAIAQCREPEPKWLNDKTKLPDRKDFIYVPAIGYGKSLALAEDSALNDAYRQIKNRMIGKKFSPNNVIVIDSVTYEKSDWVIRCPFKINMNDTLNKVYVLYKWQKVYGNSNASYTDTISIYDSFEKQRDKYYQCIKDERQPPTKNTLFRNKNLAPLGIKQFENNQKPLGYTFAISQVVVPAIWFGGFYGAALSNYNKYENRTAQTLEEHNNYYENYKKYRSIAIWGTVGTGVAIYAINVLCNYCCTNKNVEIKPRTFIDLQGNLGIGMAIGFKL